jgi:cell division protein FtsI/penicillin-binding protein 2
LLKDGTKNPDVRRVLKPETAQKMRSIMLEAVEKGSGFAARIPGYSIGGKTGTSQKPSPTGKGYLSGSYVGSFVGFIPNYRPRVLILVTIDNPRGAYYGGAVAAPVFKNIAAEVIRYLAIPPDM